MKTWKPTPLPFSKFKKDKLKKEAEVANFIYQLGEFPYLRKSSKKVSLKEIKSKEFRTKLKYLKNCLIKYRKATGYGRGVTAVQVGIPERFSVIYKGQTITNIRNKVSVSQKDLMVVINPKITKKSKKLLSYPESCMSANPVIAPTIRPSWIEFEYYDERGELNYWNTKDNSKVGKMMNRVFQHEIDHMDGVINIDIVKNPKEIILHSDPNFYKSAKFEVVK